MSVESFNRLVKLAARAFYDDITLKGENQPKNGRSDNRGMAVVVLDALTRRPWVREEDLAKHLKLHSKQLRRTLRYFEEEKLVTRDHRRETAKGAKVYTAAVAATAEGAVGKDGEEKAKMHTHSYCCLDYAQIYDVVRYRMHKMKKKLKDELENRNTVQEYICPTCKRKYSALDAAQLISPNGEYFSCEKCNTELVAESDKLAAEDIGDGDDNARRRHREKLKDMLQKIEEQLKPLTQQLARVKDLAVPEFGSLQAWEARAHAAGHPMNGDSGAIDSSRSSQGQGYGGTPMPFLGETRVEVALSGVEAKEDNDGDAGSTAMKQLPPWLIKQGMKLTAEQRGEIRSDLKSASTSAAVDEKKPKDEKDEDANLKDEYYKAYYDALYKRQQLMQEQSETSIDGQGDMNSEPSSERQVGMKSKREEDHNDDDDDDVEWEDASNSGGTNGTAKVADLNLEADATAEDDDDDDGIDWEEG